MHAGVGAARMPAGARELPPRPLRAGEQGPLDWLVPFIPPFLRVNRDTRERIWSALVHAASPEALKRSAELIAGFLKQHGKKLIVHGVLASLWTTGLYWVHDNVQEFATSYVILSGFAVLCVNLFSGDDGNKAGDGLSAYSVFNKDGRRMMGSLSAEQFENEIRHRGPRGAPGGDDEDAVLPQGDLLSDDENDPDLIEALRRSFEEKKREERRQRRARRR